MDEYVRNVIIAGSEAGRTIAASGNIYYDSKIVIKHLCPSTISMNQFETTFKAMIQNGEVIYYEPTFDDSYFELDNCRYYSLNINK